MNDTPEDRRRESAGKDSPEHVGGGQMGQQKAATHNPLATRDERQPGRDDKPDMPGDPGGRVRPQSSGHRGPLRPKDLPAPAKPPKRS